MKVKKLIDQLKNYDPEMQVFTYNSTEECDGRITGIEVVSSAEDMFYNQGDSHVEMYFEKKNKPVLILHDCV